MDQFRQRCFAELTKHGDIDPAPTSVRALLANEGDLSREDLREYEVPGGYKGGMLSALASLCRTPRLLKFSLRRCLETWKVLHGEIDFDDVLVMSVLREAEPAVFEVVANHVSKLTEIGMALTQAARDESAIERAFEDAKLQGPSHAAIRSLLHFVFPTSQELRKPQGLCHSDPRDYWRRFLAVPSLAAGERDQPILKVCGGESDADLVKHLEDPEKGHATEQFAYRLARQRDGGITADRLTDMLQIVISHRLAEAGNEWKWGRPPGLVPLWNLLVARARQRDKSQQRLERILSQGIIDCSRVNAQLLEQLDYWFLFPTDEPRLMGDEAARKLIDLVGTSLLEQHQGNPEGLASALGRSHPWALRQIVDRHRGQSGTGMPWPTWPAFASLLLCAADRYPKATLPTVVELVVARTSSSDESVYSEAQAELLFGNDRLMELARSVTAAAVDFGPNATLVQVMTRHVSRVQTTNTAGT